MSEAKPVVVYAASGYTGRLVCESLTRLRIPFVAAGRDQRRLDEVAREMRAKGADCVARATAHTPAGLRECFRGAKVVINVSGPFSLLGRAVVEAALVDGCHYVDSTGEQDFMLELRRDYDALFREARLLLSPSAAFLWAPGAAAAEHCLETTPGIDTLDVVYAPPSLQTVASLQSMIRTVRRTSYWIADGALRVVPVPDVKRVTLPGEVAHKALRIGGGEATFLLGDRRVRSCSTWFASDDLARAAGFFGLWGKLSRVVPGETLDRWSDAAVLRLKRDPPAEKPETGRFVITVTARGPSRRVNATLEGTSPYVVTGFLCAMAAQSVIDGKAERFGYCSISQAFGARYVLTRLEHEGTTMTIHGAGPGPTRPAGAGSRDAAKQSGGAHAHR